MNAQQVFERLKREYPGKVIKALPDKNPTELVCEIDPTEDHPDHDVAIAAIKSSAPHKHHKTTETYEVLEGNLILHVNNKTLKLSPGDVHVIKPGVVHWATGNFTIIKVTSRPGWREDDHFLVEV